MPVRKSALNLNYNLTCALARRSFTNPATSTSTSASSSSSSTVDQKEIELFSSLSAKWWDSKGEFRFLHSLNPIRMLFLRQEVTKRLRSKEGSHYATNTKESKPFQGLRILDIGCGGGIMSEAIARLGGEVVGVDASLENIRVAMEHLKQDPFLKGKIDYRAIAAETLAEKGEKFDIVVGSEVIEHVVDPSEFISVCSNLLQNNGILVISTLNKTILSKVLAIDLVENVFGWVSKGTHHHEKFITPDELKRYFRKSNLEPGELTGLALNPIANKWSFIPNTWVNYIASAQKL